jgi:transposase
LSSYRRTKPITYNDSRPAKLAGARLRIEQYKAQLAQLRRMQFGRSSEKLDTRIQQLE